ncbi:MAG: family 20 glycosylhydrolase [Bacteroidales bacterium]|nr:family 20 glycosylhydrolase [Bacteroidales bacterium]
MERSKMNVLVLHLNDDEGWRLEIKALPELTSFGAFHDIPTRREDGTYFNEKALMPCKVFERGRAFKGPSGYYSRKEFISFIRFAIKHGITVIPDFDFPGHCLSAIESMKARERITGDTSFRLTDPDDTSRYFAINGYHHNVIDIALPSVFHFIETVFDEVVSIYKEADVPLNQIMIGGDEVAEGAWTGSPSCRKVMADNGFTNLDQLRAWFLIRIIGLLKDRGINTSGYEEIAFNLSAEELEFLAENCGCLNIWAPLNKENAYKSYDYANKGLPILLSPGSHTYCDNTYSMAWDEPNVFWAGILDERRAFSLLPFRLGKSDRFDNYHNPIDMTALDPYIPELNKPENIIGVQSMLWCDLFYETDLAFKFLFPKTYGLYERAWNAQPSWQDSTDPYDPGFISDFNRFYTTVVEREIPYLDSIGIAHRAAMTNNN